MARSLLCARLRAVILSLFVAAIGTGAIAQSAGPQPVPLPPPIPAPVDTAYAGTITLLVDATNVNDRVLQVHETIPVKPGKLTLLYPEWFPGAHSPTLANRMAGLVITANGNRVAWVRDRVDMHAFHITVPQAVLSLDIEFQYLAPVSPKEGRISSKFADVSWFGAVLYPAGYFTRRIPIAASVRLPDGWKFACALETKSQDGNLVHFKETTLNTLVDSPVYAGVNFKRVDLSTGPDNPVYLDIFSDTPAQLEISPEELQFHKNLAIQAQKVFHSHHYDHYDFLLSVSDNIGHEGLEHHQSSEDGLGGNYFTDWAAGVGGRDLLAHEYTHSWNGKFRRPADLWTPNWNVPMQNDLLWVYEGLTQYYGFVLTARSGLRTIDESRDVVAFTASSFEISPGRTWRPLIDTTNEPIIGMGGKLEWGSWQRGYDYYMESMLIWLEADTKIRELSNDKKSLDDFAQLFFGMDNGSYITKTYTLDDVVGGLNSVQPFDWAGFLRTRVYELAPQVPEAGITDGGYRLVYSDDMPEWLKHTDPTGGVSFARSLGFIVTPEGNIVNVIWSGLAFKAGITPDMQLQAINDQKFTMDSLREAIKSAEKSKDPLKLLLKRGDDFITVSLDYHDGLRYPHLERVQSVPDRLDAILAPVK